jgi:hypothetical protein
MSYLNIPRILPANCSGEEAGAKKEQLKNHSAKELKKYSALLICFFISNT